MRRHYELLKYLHSDRRATDRNLSVRRTSSGGGDRAPERITSAEVAGTKRISVGRTKPILGFEQRRYPAYALRVPARNAIISSAVCGRRLPPDISLIFSPFFSKRHLDGQCEGFSRGLRQRPALVTFA